MLGKLADLVWGALKLAFLLLWFSILGAAIKSCDQDEQFKRLERERNSVYKPPSD